VSEVVGLETALDLDLTSISSHYKKGTNDGALESHARNGGNADRFFSLWMEAKTDVNLKEIRAGQELLKEEMLAKMEVKTDSHH
jgi:hypothetical protein